MPTTNYHDSSFGIFAIGSRTDEAGAALPDLSSEEARLVSSLMSEGYIDDPNSFVVQHDSGMSITVGSANAKNDTYIVPGRSQGQGNYLVRHESTAVSITVPAADSSQERIDEVYLVVQDGDYDAGAKRVTRLAYRVGDPGGGNPGSGTWAGWSRIARITIPAGANTASDITDLRTNAKLIASLLTGAELPSPESDSSIATREYVLQSAGYRHIQTIEVNSAVNGITFTNIPQNFRNLYIIGRAKAESPDQWSSLSLRMGDDTTIASSDYRSLHIVIDGNGFQATSAEVLSRVVVGSLNRFSQRGSFEILIPSYSAPDGYPSVRSVYHDNAGEANSSMRTGISSGVLFTTTGLIVRRVQLVTWSADHSIARGVFSLYGVL